jgi:two-component system cell cycle sensor histidine kinase/response regulator CckA
MADDVTSIGEGLDSGDSERRAIRVLHVEDEPKDAELIRELLHDAGFEATVEQVGSRDAFLAALARTPFDLVLSDYTLPGFDGLTALTLAQTVAPSLPFIAVSGTLDEEAAVEMVRHGATDYILKDRLARLPTAIRRALQDREDQRRRLGAEEALTRTEAQLRQSQKMEAIGRLAGGVAHDFNNLLMSILGHANLIQARQYDDPRLASDVAEIARAAESAATLTRQLLTFSRKEPSQVGLVNASAVIREMTGMLSRIIGTDIVVLTELADDDLWVSVGSSHVEQVLMNLVVNARDAMPNGGEIRIAATRHHLRSPLAAHFTTIPPGSYVVLSVTDAGTGMSSEIVGQVFEPFFTTKPVGQGTGLGLSIVHGIVKQCAGDILISSVPGRGTALDVYIPAAERPAQSVPEPAYSPEPTAASEMTVLVIDDESQIRTLTAGVLRDVGYTVIECASRDEALAICEGSPPVSLILSDVVMSGLNAEDFDAALRRLGVCPPIVYMSGYVGIRLPQGPRGECPTLLQKPFSMDDLLSTVAAAMPERSKRLA